MLVLRVYTISIIILCVLYEEIILIESNQLICDFYKSMTFEQPRHCKTLNNVKGRVGSIVRGSQFFLSPQKTYFP